MASPIKTPLALRKVNNKEVRDLVDSIELMFRVHKDTLIDKIIEGYASQDTGAQADGKSSDGLGKALKTDDLDETKALVQLCWDIRQCIKRPDECTDPKVLYLTAHLLVELQTKPSKDSDERLTSRCLEALELSMEKRHELIIYILRKGIEYGEVYCLYLYCNFLLIRAQYAEEVDKFIKRVSTLGTPESALIYKRRCCFKPGPDY